MTKHLTLIGLASILALACTSAATAGTGTTVLLGDTGWEAFTTTAASFAWSGEDETFADATSLLGKARQTVQLDESVVDVELLTGLPAPEPPALVLAGMAFGGVLCGRSLLLRRRKATDPIDAEENGSDSEV